MQAIPEERGVQLARRIQEARADVVKEDVLPVRQALQQAVVRGDAVWPETRRLLSADVARQDGQQVKPRGRLLDPAANTSSGAALSPPRLFVPISTRMSRAR